MKSNSLINELIELKSNYNMTFNDESEDLINRVIKKIERLEKIIETSERRRKYNALQVRRLTSKFKNLKRLVSIQDKRSHRRKVHQVSIPPLKPSDLFSSTSLNEVQKY
jgi:hypothetical protein